MPELRIATVVCVCISLMACIGAVGFFLHETRKEWNHPLVGWGVPLVVASVPLMGVVVLVALLVWLLRG